MRRFIPGSVISMYHWLLGLLAAFWFGFPSRRLLVIGVTGTNGKSTVVNLIGRIFIEAGFSVGWASTINFRLGEREWLNDKKMTMLGRFQLQKLLRQMVCTGCQVAIIETSSEGILQYRHRFINYDAVVFTNLTPEHLERHGGWENYRRAKEKLFAHLLSTKRKKIQIHSIMRHSERSPVVKQSSTTGRSEESPVPTGSRMHERSLDYAHAPLGMTTKNLVIPKIMVVNADDPNVGYFVQYPADQKIAFRFANAHELPTANWQDVAIHEISHATTESTGSRFSFLDTDFNLSLLGKFNIQNAAAAIGVAQAYGVVPIIAARALAQVNSLPGRLEFIQAGQPFGIIVDYAPEPASFQALYDVVAKLPHKKIIHVFGSAGGGRDRARRPMLGQIAAAHADHLIITNEDPYDENPQAIIDEVAAGAIPHLTSPLERGRKLEKILDRREAIRRALELAQEGDLILITGKGAEQAMAVADGKYIPWDDRKVVKEELVNLGLSPP